jgi:hypothetical protein
VIPARQGRQFEFSPGHPDDGRGERKIFLNFRDHDDLTSACFRPVREYFLSGFDWRERFSQISLRLTSSRGPQYITRVVKPGDSSVLGGILGVLGKVNISKEEGEPKEG